MALKYIPQSWKDDMRTNFNHDFNFYINPRGRVLPALTSAGVSYIKNDITINMRGTYRMQCGASTDLTYAYTLPQRFIIEGWFKPEFAYDVASAQDIFNIPSLTDACSMYYSASNDVFSFSTTVGGVNNLISTSPAFTSSVSLQKWIYVRCFFDNLAKLKGFYCTVNGVVYANSQNVPGAGDSIPLNTVSLFLATDAESSYWIIHELDETLTTGEYKTYQADRQIIFDFNGTTLGRERIRIPVVHTPTDTRGVKSFSLSKSVENPMTGSAGANTASMTLYNVNGQFSDDQYDAFDPFQGRYNGTQKYLQNRVGVEIESRYKRSGSVNDIPNGTPVYLDDAWASSDGWIAARMTLSYAYGVVRLTSTGVDPQLLKVFTTASLTTKKIRIKARKISGTTWDSIIFVYDAVYGDLKQLPLTNFAASTPGMWAIDTVTIPALATADRVRIDLGASSDTIAEIDWIYIGDLSELTDTMPEPLFIGRTTPGAFRRSSPNHLYGEATIDIEDGISELGETKLRRAYGFDSYDLSDPANESDSLYHSIARLVTKKEIRNYIGNSSIENATIANSWTNTGMATFERSNTYAQFGTYSMKCIADTIGDKVTQRITFSGVDKIDVDDVFNFSAYIRQGTASAVKIMIEETDGAGTIIGAASQTVCGTDIDRFTRVNVSRTILSSSCVGLRVTIYAVATSTFYADGFMLTRGIDPVDWNIVNANDGAAGVIGADSYTAGLYDSVAIDADAVDIEHPYALVEKGNTAWDAMKKIGDASIAAYNGMSPDGVLQFRVRYNSADMENLGDVEDFGGVATSLDVKGANAIKVHGVIIVKETAEKQLWTAEGAGIFLTDSGSKVKQPILNGNYLTISGANTVEMKYEEN
jgi:hypothetical protein